MAPLRALAALLGTRSTSPAADLRRGGREVGYALVRRDAGVVETLRDTIDRAESASNADPERAAAPPAAPAAIGGDDANDDGAFARGYRAALADAVAGFAAALDARLEIERTADTLGRREAQVLRALDGDARPQVRVARELAMAPHDVSRAAKRLRTAGLVKAYAGERETEQLHRVTALGRAVVRELDARAARDAGAAFATGTPPVAETPLYAEESAWSPAPPPPDARPVVAAARAARASSPSVHELDTASDRWTAHPAADEDE